MTRIILKGSRIFKIVEEDGKKSLVINSEKFIRRLRKSWIKANELTSDKSKIGYAFYEAMFKLFSDMMATQEIPMDSDDDSIMRSMEMTIFVDPKKFANQDDDAS